MAVKQNLIWMHDDLNDDQELLYCHSLSQKRMETTDAVLNWMKVLHRALELSAKIFFLLHFISTHRLDIGHLVVYPLKLFCWQSNQCWQHRHLHSSWPKLLYPLASLSLLYPYCQHFVVLLKQDSYSCIWSSSALPASQILNTWWIFIYEFKLNLSKP